MDNELLIQSHYVGVDAALRLIVRDSDEFLFRVQPGDIIHANIAGEVIASNNKDFEVGDFVTGALGIAEIIGLNDLIVGMTIVSLGTSAPEIFTTISAYKRRESNLIIGNIMGSNIINILLVGGVLGLISRVQVDFSNMFYHNSILLFLTLLFIIVIVSLKKMGRFLGIIFISIYLIFIYLNFVIA